MLVDSRRPTRAGEPGAGGVVEQGYGWNGEEIGRGRDRLGPVREWNLQWHMLSLKRLPGPELHALFIELVPV